MNRLIWPTHIILFILSIGCSSNYDISGSYEETDTSGRHLDGDATVGLSWESGEPERYFRFHFRQFGGTARLNQVEMIENSIDEIKGKLSQLERLTQDNAQYKKLVSSLRTVIAEKEKEIEDLKAEIQSRDQTINEQNEMISAQHGTIAMQNETITAQQANLEKAVAEQARLLFQAGQDFETLGDESPTVSRRKDKAKVQSLTVEMYEKAILYYSKAQETGYPAAAARIDAVKQKLASVTK